VGTSSCAGHFMTPYVYLNGNLDRRDYSLSVDHIETDKDNPSFLTHFN